jgi:magnesium-transporting ATPase (P-type)
MDLHQVRDFMVVFGLLSTAFDLVTFAVLFQVFHADADLFRTGWFVGSALTELTVLFVLRTRRIAFRSVPGRALFITSVAVALLTLAIPFMPFAAALGLTPPAPAVILSLLAITATYIVAAEITIRVYYSGRHSAVGSEIAEARAVRDANGDIRDWNGLPTNTGGAHDRAFGSTMFPARGPCRSDLPPRSAEPFEVR